MYRRGLFALLLGGTSAGCLTEYAPSGPRNPPEGDDTKWSSRPDGDDDGLAIHEWDFFEGGDGELVVEVVVGNDADAKRSGTISVVVTVGDEKTVRNKDVHVLPDEETAVEFHYDVAFEEFTADGAIDLDLS